MDVRGLDCIGVASIGPRASSDDSFGAVLGDTGGGGASFFRRQRPLRSSRRYAPAPITERLPRPLLRFSAHYAVAAASRQ